MSAALWIIVAVAAALALYAAGAVGWALGRRASAAGGSSSAMPVLREVPARTPADVLVALRNLPDLLERRDVLVINTVTTGIDPRAEVVDVAVLDTTGELRMNRLSLAVNRIPREASDTHGLTRDRLREVHADPWPVVYAELVDLLATATLVLGYNAGLHRRMLTQTAERHGLKRLPVTDWACLMRTYTQMTAGPDAPWIELAAARTRERLAAPVTHWAMEDGRTALELLRILACREASEVRQPRQSR